MAWGYLIAGVISIVCALFLIMAAELLFPLGTGQFRCDYCRLTAEEKPIHRSEQTVNMTICSGC